jgi:hypothetical protein
MMMKSRIANADHGPVYASEIALQCGWPPDHDHGNQKAGMISV